MYKLAPLYEAMLRIKTENKIVPEILWKLTCNIARKKEKKEMSRKLIRSDHG